MLISLTSEQMADIVCHPSGLKRNQIGTEISLFATLADWIILTPSIALLKCVACQSDFLDRYQENILIPPGKIPGSFKVKKYRNVMPALNAWAAWA